MNISILSVLLGLGGKCLLNWTLVFLQRSHICRSFVGVFSVSLSVVDTAVTLIFAAIHIHTHTDGPLFLLDWQLTRYHTCLLVQILGQVYSLLQWPVVLVASLDQFCTVSLPAASSGVKGIVHSIVTVLLWNLTVLYVFLLSDFDPVLEDVSHHQRNQCWVFPTTQILQVVTLLSLTLACSVLHAVCSSTLLENPPEKNPITNQSRTHSRRSIVCQVLSIFLSTWAPLLIFLAMLLLLPVGIPSYLGLNVAWLCFLNSFLITLVLCVVCPTPRLAQGLAAVPADSFCEWRIKFNLAAEDRT
ncbi:probable G-protein coupled receptor 160 [Hippoglossus stenolepis]|uniref:probable G-protein coupled receptor 160 n=1 Tax=Hippoglossus stenolepis TaxID=195615 RepID=UPI001FAF787C|nr:probable G-protein coupled receptor 160 [Hippoglossus stenolepis]XP_035025247.2 probable G-protein coupled receptor 160 [Hippoglossus stenolepis]